MFYRPNQATTRKYDTVGVGRAYLYITSPASTEFLKSHNIPINGHRECSTEEMNELRELLHRKNFSAGGYTYNSLAMIISLGGKSGLFGKVNNLRISYDDGRARNFYNVPFICDTHSHGPQLDATCLVLINDDKRSFIYSHGCADYFTSADFQQFDFSTTNNFLIESQLITSPVAKAAVIESMKLAKNKCTVVVNLRGITDWNRFPIEREQILLNADIVIGNDAEQTAFAGSQSQLLITNKSAEGVYASQANNVICHVPAQKPRVFVNSLGIEDAFIGGFLFGLSKGMTLDESMRRGALAACAISEIPGANTF